MELRRLSNVTNSFPEDDNDHGSSECLECGSDNFQNKVCSDCGFEFHDWMYWQELFLQES